MVHAEAAKESGVDEEVTPTLADGRGAREGGRLGREAEEDLPKHVVIFNGGSAAAADHCSLAFVDVGTYGGVDLLY